MVFPDFSVNEARTNKDKQFPIAAVSDRLIALILDFLVFSPVVSLLVAGYLKQTRTLFLLNTSAQEAMVAAGLLVGIIFFVVVLLQTAFLFFWQATPGQLFLQLRVVQYPAQAPNFGSARLSLNQCFLRAFLWCTGFAVLALPFLEIASHPLRRAFHERASDTAVMTLKSVPDDGPHVLESRFIASWMRMSFLLLFLFVAIGFSQTYRSLLVGEFKESDAKTSVASSCKEIKGTELKGADRLDAALTLYLLEAISPECLKKEADLVLWSQPDSDEGLAYLAKYVITDGDEQHKYFEKMCESRDSVSCLMARYMTGEGGLDEITADELKGYTAQFLVSEEKFSQQDVVGSLKMVEALQGQALFKQALEKRYVRSIWALQESLELPSRGREPASSAEKSQELIEKFKERYEVP